MVTTAVDDYWYQQALRREQLADNELGPLMREIEVERRPEWRISVTGPQSTKAMGASGNYWY
jgi:hypothetical protein